MRRSLCFTPLVWLLLWSPLTAQAAPFAGPFFPTALPVAGPEPPWSARSRDSVPEMRGKAKGLIDLALWPAEPAAPRQISTAKLAQALGQLCRHDRVKPKMLASYADHLLRYGQQFEVDPFLLAALIYDQSHCRARKQNSYGVGLTMINPPMHGPRIQQGRYRYWVLRDEVWQPRQLAVDRFPFSRETLLQPEANIYFAAALLRIYQEQYPAADRCFRSVPHRHPVSHFIWGDQVRGAGAEDRILQARRQLISYHEGSKDPGLGQFGELRLSCPLDGAPRKITGGLGDDREDGRRIHKGVDFDSVYGEPVRAVAAGTVTLAGIDLGQGELRSFPPPASRRVPEEAIGPRGILVTIEHAGGLVSAYMHLSGFVVRTGQQVQAGDLLGYVGRTGIKQSAAHLHFELRYQGRFLDPMLHLRSYLLPPGATYLGRRNAARQRQRRLRRRLAQIRASMLRYRRCAQHHQGLGLRAAGRCEQAVGVQDVFWLDGEHDSAADQR